jgi:plastocyanin
MRKAWLGSLFTGCAGVTAGAAVLMVSMLIAPPASADPECNHRLLINTSGKRPTSVDPDTARVRQGETVCWKVVGKPSEIFAITYKDRSPTKSSARSKNGWVVQVIDEPHTGDPAKDSYAYNVTIQGGGTLDPQLIIDP